MKLSSVVLASILAALCAQAAPVATSDADATVTGTATDFEDGSAIIQEATFPEEAIEGVIPLEDDFETLVGDLDGQKVIMIINATLADSYDNSTLAKRDAGWLKYRLFEPNLKVKRDAEADAGWLKYRLFEPNLKVKRDAEAEAEAGWLKYRLFEPNLKVKRDAEAEADAGWLKYRLFEPNLKKKRDAEADADAGWLKYRLFEPNLKKKREAEADADAGWLKYRLFEPNL